MKQHNHSDIHRKSNKKALEITDKDFLEFDVAINKSSKRNKPTKTSKIKIIDKSNKHNKSNKINEQLEAHNRNFVKLEGQVNSIIQNQNNILAEFNKQINSDGQTKEILKLRELIENQTKQITEKHHDNFKQYDELNEQILKYLQLHENSNDQVKTLIKSQRTSLENTMIDCMTYHSLDQDKSKLLYESLINEILNINNNINYQNQLILNNSDKLTKKVINIKKHVKVHNESNNKFMSEIRDIKSKNSNDYDKLMNEVIIIKDKLNNSKSSNDHDKLMNEVIIIKDKLNNLDKPNNFKNSDDYDKFMNELIIIKDKLNKSNNSDNYDKLINELITIKDKLNNLDKLDKPNNSKNSDNYDKLINELITIKDKLNNLDKLDKLDKSNNSRNSDNYDKLMNELITIKDKLNNFDVKSRNSSDYEKIMNEIMNIKSENSINYDKLMKEIANNKFQNSNEILDNFNTTNESYELLKQEIFNILNNRSENNITKLTDIVKNSNEKQNELLIKEILSLSNNSQNDIVNLGNIIKSYHEAQNILLTNISNNNSNNSNNSKNDIINLNDIIKSYHEEQKILLTNNFNNSKNDIINLNDIIKSYHEEQKRLLTNLSNNMSNLYNNNSNNYKNDIVNLNDIIKSYHEEQKTLLTNLYNNSNNSKNDIVNLSNLSNNSQNDIMRQLLNLTDIINNMKKCSNELVIKETLNNFTELNNDNLNKSQNQLIKEIIDLRNNNSVFHQKIENLILQPHEIIDITNFNDWNKSDFDDEYNINPEINIVHKKYLSELINKSIKSNQDVSEQLSNFNTVFYNNDNSKEELIFKNIIASTKTLLKLVHLSDESGKFIKYEFPPLTNDDKMKMLFDMIITGFNTQLNEHGSLSGILDISKIKSQFITLIDKSILKSNSREKLKLMLDNIFNKYLDKSILSWQQLMIKYFTMINMINPTLTDIYKSDNSDEKLTKANIFVHDYHNLAKQISSFLEIFHNIGIFLTTFINMISAGKIAEIKLKTNDLKWWNQHLILIFDYHKSLILKDIDNNKKIKEKLSILEIPPDLINTFDIYNNLMVNLYKILKDQ